MSEYDIKPLCDKLTRYELGQVLREFENTLPDYPYLWDHNDTKGENIRRLLRWIMAASVNQANELERRLKEAVAKKEAYPVIGPVSGTRYIKWSDFTKLPSYELIARAVDYPHDYRRKCSPVTKDEYVSVDAILNMEAWANWKSSSLGAEERAIANAIHKLPLLDLMRLNRGRRHDQPALFPVGMLPIVTDRTRDPYA